MIYAILFVLYFIHKTTPNFIVPERPQIEYLNPKYIEWANISIMRINRQSPHYINFGGKIYTPVGNNVSFSMALFEYLSNRYQPTLVQYQYKMCNFFTDPMVGILFAKSFLRNLTCPFPAGEYHFSNLTAPVLPYEVPHTWTSNDMKGRLDLRYFHTDTNETLALVLVHLTIYQKNHNKSPRKSGNGRPLLGSNRESRIKMYT